MPPSNLPRYVRLASLLAAGACDPGADSGGKESGPSALTLYTTCGDPACRGYDASQHTNPVCTTEAEGDPCATAGDGCDLQADCNVELICATTDPKDGTGGCPISVAAAKTEIRYVSAADAVALHHALLRVKLADYRYKTECAGDRRHLGFLIDDQPDDSPAVLAGGERVDLYGYASMAVAALQVQAARLAAQEAQIAAQQEQITSFAARMAALERLVASPMGTATASPS